MKGKNSFMLLVGFVPMSVSQVAVVVVL